MEEILLNYGVLGAWTVYLIYEKRVILNKITGSIDNLSKAINDWRSE